MSSLDVNKKVNNTNEMKVTNQLRINLNQINDKDPNYNGTFNSII